MTSEKAKGSTSTMHSKNVHRKLVRLFKMGQWKRGRTSHSGSGRVGRAKRPKGKAEKAKLEDYASRKLDGVRQMTAEAAIGFRHIAGFDGNRFIRFCAGLLWKFGVAEEAVRTNFARAVPRDFETDCLQYCGNSSIGRCCYNSVKPLSWRHRHFAYRAR
jgi:hypothetical protein